RIFLIVLARGRLQGVARGIDGMMHFVRERLLPQDMVAVLAWNRATEFTTDRAKIVAVLERFKRAHEGIEAKLYLRFSGPAVVYGSREFPSSLQREIDAVFNGPESLRVRSLQSASVPNASRLEEDNRRATDERMAAVRDATPDTREAADAALDDYLGTHVQTSQDFEKLFLGVEYLRRVDGEKHLVFVSSAGLTLPRADNDRDLAAAASDARVVIDYVHTSGMAVSGLGAINAGSGSAGAIALGPPDWRM